ncbi:hypothetical protein [Neisseria yangbaofengii]|uniref:hypothetical protein n=1 Tax=Neisseria yangbaofengii TaxID=2709396 RepID=UPI0013E9AF74|nr:hypothetical protein [Neisseria yangbaofengii]
MRELNNRELSAVNEGFAIPGAIAGYGTYAGNVAASGRKFNWRDAGYATTLGAAGGAIGGPMGITAAVDLVGLATVGGMAQGFLTR